MPVHIETHEIRTFKAVHDHQGFKKAADKLFVTQSAVSQTVANLETKLACSLFERNPLRLTETGMRLLNYAEIVLSEEQVVLEDILNIKQGILSTLLLAISGSINLLYGHQLMARYCQYSPLTKIKLNVMPSRQIITAVASDLWELGLGPFQQNMPNYFSTYPLYQDARLLVINHQHKEMGANAEMLLHKVPLIISHLDDEDLRPAVDKLRGAFGTIWEVNDTELRINMVQQGLGMGYLDQSLLDNRLGAQQWHILDCFPFARIPLQFGIYHRKKKKKKKTVI